jgi:glutamine synthetase
MQEKKSALEKILFLLEKENLEPFLGGEIEFYLLQVEEKEAQELLQAIEEKTGLKVEKEKGFHQYEIITSMKKSFEIIEEISRIQKILLSFPKISLKPKPYLEDYGSALHLHLSLWQKGENLFNREKNLEDNFLLMKSIGGILSILNPSLYLITGSDPEEFLRFEKPLLSPSHLSWGKNNRTTAIRIPDSLPANRNRRIEFRLASAQTDPELLILLLLTGILYGIKKEMVKIPICLYGNSQDPQYNLEKLFNLEKAKNAFSFWEIFEELCKNI